jgi:hypothetical protein
MTAKAPQSTDFTKDALGRYVWVSAMTRSAPAIDSACKSHWVRHSGGP